jgi:alpha-tubulin suppressor-like RCC1 family protein
VSARPARRRPLAPATPRLVALAAAAATLTSLAAVTPSTARFEDAGAASAVLLAAEDDELLLTGGVEAGDGHSIGWTEEGELFAWGRNREGQLGIGTAEPSDGQGYPRPVRVPLPAGEQVVDACAGADATIALTEDADGRRSVFTWGGSSGGVGGSWANNTPSPQRVAALEDPDDPVVQVEAGAYFYLARTAAGRLFSWGLADNRLGRPVVAGDPNAPPREVTAQLLHSSDVEVIHASAGRFHSAAVTDDGRVVVWGNQQTGNSGGAVVTGIVGVPVEVAAGRDATLIRTADGRVFQTTGTHATEPTTSVGASIAPVDGIAVSSPVAAGSRPSYFAWRGAASGSRTLYAWGDGSSGQLGYSIPVDHIAHPTMVGLPIGSVPHRFAAGGAHTLYESTTGQYAATGLNDLGQLGDGTRDGRSLFVYVIGLSRWS